jgi:hypothetical protein
MSVRIAVAGLGAMGLEHVACLRDLRGSGCLDSRRIGSAPDARGD